MIATTRLISFSSTLTSLSSFRMPTLGIMPSSDSSGPSLRICLSCLRKSSRVKSFSMSLRCISTACFLSMASSAFSMKLRISPMPRMRLAARSGWNGVERVGFLAHADEFQRLSGDVADGDRAAAAGVAVHLGQDYARDAEPLVEFVGRFDGVLPRHGVGHEEDFHRVELLDRMRVV